MAKEVVPIGILLSRTGSYRTVGEAMYSGAMLAIAEVNASESFQFVLSPVAVDPAGVTHRYVEGAKELLADGKVTHVIGCYTSSSRKDVLPVFEKNDALLWYTSHYEGFETSENIIYTGAAPNQHVVPLTRHLLKTNRRRAFFIGSNYIWAWENNRVMRDMLVRNGGHVMAERYVPIDDVDLDEIIAMIVKNKPDFVFSTLIGESAYAFYRKFRQAAELAGLDQARDIPVASCSLAEPELARIGADCDGHLSSSVYFASIDSPENTKFLSAWHQQGRNEGWTSADAEAPYIAVHLLARAISEGGAANLETVRDAVTKVSFLAPQGLVKVDPENRHCHLRARIGRSKSDGTFEIIYESPRPIRPDPYLIWEPTESEIKLNDSAPSLRVVS